MSIIGLLVLLISSAITFLILKKTYKEFKSADVKDAVDQLVELEASADIVTKAEKQFKAVESKKKQVKNFVNKNKKPKQRK